MKDTILFLMLLGVVACRPHTIPTHTTTDSAVAGDSVRFMLLADNLTEDVSRVSSGNDEMLFLLYSTQDSLQSFQLIGKQLFVFDKSQKTHEQRIAAQWLKNEWLILLLEIDSERSVDELEAWVRQHLPIIVTAYRKKQTEQLRKLLGDEDLIAIELFPADSRLVKEFTFRGVHLFDEYQYRLKIQSEK